MQTQKRLFAVLLATFVILSTAALLAKDNPMGIAQKQTITFSSPTVVGGSLLPAGEYKVVHEMQGENHIMIFTKVGGKVEVKANCKLVPLSEKASRNEQRYTENAKNERVLTQMTFKGDKATHVLEP